MNKKVLAVVLAVLMSSTSQGLMAANAVHGAKTVAKASADYAYSITSIGVQSNDPTNVWLGVYFNALVPNDSVGTYTLQVDGNGINKTISLSGDYSSFPVLLSGLTPGAFYNLSFTLFDPMGVQVSAAVSYSFEAGAKFTNVNIVDAAANTLGVYFDSTINAGDTKGYEVQFTGSINETDAIFGNESSYPVPLTKTTLTPGQTYSGTATLYDPSGKAFSSSFPYQFTVPGSAVSVVNQTPYVLWINENENGDPVSSCGTGVPCYSMLLPFMSQPLSATATLQYTANSVPMTNYMSISVTISPTGAVSATSQQLPANTSVSVNGSEVDFNFTPSFPATVQSYPTGIRYRGVNLSGAESGGSIAHGGYVDLSIPSLEDAQYYVQKGMNTVRFPILWEYLPDPNNPAGTAVTLQQQEYLIAVHVAIAGMLSKGINVILDLHNYMRYPYNKSTTVSAANMNEVWGFLGSKFKDLATQYDGTNARPNQLMFEIMNEPYNMLTPDVLADENAGIAAIRNQSLKNLVLLDGNSWAGLHGWTTVQPDEGGADALSNGSVFVKGSINDTDNNYAIVAHEYFDSDGSGTQATCQAPADFQTYANFAAFVTWMQTNNMRVFLTEFGSDFDATGNCVADVNWLLSQMELYPYKGHGQGGFMGWTAWVAGHGWSVVNMNDISPNPITGAESEQMTQIYEKHLTPLP